jgi:hypothetical protein
MGVEILGLSWSRDRLASPRAQNFLMTRKFQPKLIFLHDFKNHDESSVAGHDELAA